MLDDDGDIHRVSLSGLRKMVKRTIYKAHLSRMRPNNAREVVALLCFRSVPFRSAVYIVKRIYTQVSVRFDFFFAF